MSLGKVFACVISLTKTDDRLFCLLGCGHCVVFLGKTLYSHFVSFHPGVSIGTGEVSAGKGGLHCSGLTSQLGNSYLILYNLC